MTTKDDIKLLPCPFCGSDADEINDSPNMDDGAVLVMCSSVNCGAQAEKSCWQQRDTTPQAESSPSPVLPADRKDALDEARNSAVYSEVVTLPIPVYERMKAALQTPSVPVIDGLDAALKIYDEFGPMPDEEGFSMISVFAEAARWVAEQNKKEGV